MTLRAVTPKKEIFYARPPQSATGRERDSGSDFEVAMTRYVIATYDCVLPDPSVM